MNTEANTFQFVASWLMFFVILIALNQTRIGHVAIYYGLLLLILFILVTEYRQITPFLNPPTLGQLNTSLAKNEGAIPVA